MFHRLETNVRMCICSLVTKVRFSVGELTSISITVAYLNVLNGSTNPENLMEGFCCHITHVALSAHFLSVLHRRTADTWAAYELTFPEMVKPSAKYIQPNI